jgi:hypothetical protein
MLQRCDEGKPTCASCARLGIECLGYGAKRPKWLKDETNAKRAKLEIKETVSRKRQSKSRQGDAADAAWVERPPPTTSGLWEINLDGSAAWTSSAEPGSVVTATGAPPFAGCPPFNLDPDLDAVWRLLFSQPNGTQWQNPWFSTPSPSAGLTASLPNHNYLHHYLNVVLPLQYRFKGSLSIGELVAPLAQAKAEVLTSVSSLAALHMSVKRNRAVDPTRFVTALGETDDDARVAIASHRDSIERLRFISSDDFTSEDIILSAMFAVSYQTFMGGTSKEWKEVLAISQRCLSAALAGSPELTGGTIK